MCQTIFCCDADGFRGCKKKMCVTHVAETKEHDLNGQLCSICSECHAEYALVSRSNLCKITFCSLFWIAITSLIMVLVIQGTSSDVSAADGIAFTGK